jgi:hypothetical protein
MACLQGQRDTGASSAVKSMRDTSLLCRRSTPSGPVRLHHKTAFTPLPLRHAGSLAQQHRAQHAAMRYMLIHRSSYKDLQFMSLVSCSVPNVRGDALQSSIILCKVTAVNSMTFILVHLVRWCVGRWAVVLVTHASESHQSVGARALFATHWASSSSSWWGLVCS